ncbi:hypothetical protein M099_3928 [Phocaeicola vulgatus str. 3975 RP4]|uniref:Uncharacterized protein n=1 Tax=Phocaeicola vulgatus str. 3975 RP4 TaxID=1339352 RepID=A0A069SD30_PHOVU|nr:hypothetical protein M099_3928 [Phocaeicola vulgatus str. 3975 RP4]
MVSVLQVNGCRIIFSILFYGVNIHFKINVLCRIRIDLLMDFNSMFSLFYLYVKQNFHWVSWVAL